MSTAIQRSRVDAGACTNHKRIPGQQRTGPARCTASMRSPALGGQSIGWDIDTTITSDELVPSAQLRQLRLRLLLGVWDVVISRHHPPWPPVISAAAGTQRQRGYGPKLDHDRQLVRPASSPGRLSPTWTQERCLVHRPLLLFQRPQPLQIQCGFFNATRKSYNRKRAPARNGHKRLGIRRSRPTTARSSAAGAPGRPRLRATGGGTANTFSRTPLSLISPL